MQTVFSLEYFMPHFGSTEKSRHNFALTEADDGFFASTDGHAVRIPREAFEPLYGFLRQQLSKSGPDRAPLADDVRQLVIAAREAWEDATDADALQRLDKALEAFAEAVPYENEPERCAVSGRPIGPNDWHCGNGVLRDQFTMAMLVTGKASCADMDDLDYLARQCGPLFTGHSIARLLPGAPVQGDPTDDDLPF